MLMCQNVAHKAARWEKAKPMKLIVVYAILAAAGIATAIGLGEIVEVTYPSASLLAFMGFFFIMLWVAWVAAVRVTGD